MLWSGKGSQSNKIYHWFHETMYFYWMIGYWKYLVWRTLVCSVLYLTATSWPEIVWFHYDVMRWSIFRIESISCIWLPVLGVWFHLILLHMYKNEWLEWWINKIIYMSIDRIMNWLEFCSPFCPFFFFFVKVCRRLRTARKSIPTVPAIVQSTKKLQNRIVVAVIRWSLFSWRWCPSCGWFGRSWITQLISRHAWRRWWNITVALLDASFRCRCCRRCCRCLSDCTFVHFIDFCQIRCGKFLSLAHT